MGLIRHIGAYALLAPLLIVLAFFVSAFPYNTSDLTASPEVAFSSLSPSGPSGGSVIPASCESWQNDDDPYHVLSGSPASCSPQSCTSAANACGETRTGVMTAAGCSATPPPNPGNYGGTCNSAPNSCGQTNSGTIRCDGSCSATTPSNNSCAQPAPTVTCSASPNPTPYGGNTTVTWSSTNATSCDVRFYGGTSDGTSGSISVGPIVSAADRSVTCTGAGGSATCDLLINPAGASCPAGQVEGGTWKTSPNSGFGPYPPGCGSPTPVAGAPCAPLGSICISGTTDYSCTQPPSTCVPPGGNCVPNYGNSCTSAPNSCGQTNSGTILCNGTCSATTPSNNSCTVTLTQNPTVTTSDGTTGAPFTLTWGSTNATSCSMQKTAPNGTIGTVSCYESASDKKNGSCQPTPAIIGNHVYTFTCQRAGGQSSASVTHQVTLSSTPPPTNNSVCVGMTAPSTVTFNANFNASVTMRNTGTKMWNSDATPHKLGSQNPQDTMRWNINRVALPVGSVSTNNTATFNFTAKAPATPGTYAFDWKMVEDGVEWFGQTCAKSIQVVGNVCYPNPNPPNYGEACTSAANSCGARNNGTIRCDGTCSAQFPPPVPPNFGVACTSAPNCQGQTVSGTIRCDGTCSGIPPGGVCNPGTGPSCTNPPSNYGQACTSEPNCDGETAQGTIQCNGSCSGIPPGGICNPTGPTSCSNPTNPPVLTATPQFTARYSTLSWAGYCDCTLKDQFGNLYSSAPRGTLQVGPIIQPMTYTLSCVDQVDRRTAIKQVLVWPLTRYEEF